MNWIKYTEKKPPVRLRVLAQDSDNRDIYIGSYNEDDWFHGDSIDGDAYCLIHAERMELWKPIPREEKEESVSE